MAPQPQPEKRFFQIGRRPHELTLKPAGAEAWRRGRVPLTKRHWLAWRGISNPKSLRRERRLLDKRPLWWTIGLGGLLVVTPFLSDQAINIAAIRFQRDLMRPASDLEEALFRLLRRHRLLPRFVEETA